jgi:hypothetical protein
MQPTIILILSSGLWVCAVLFIWTLCVAAGRPRPHMNPNGPPARS